MDDVSVEVVTKHEDSFSSTSSEELKAESQASSHEDSDRDSDNDNGTKSDSDNDDDAKSESEDDKSGSDAAEDDKSDSDAAEDEKSETHSDSEDEKSEIDVAEESQDESEKGSDNEDDDAKSENDAASQSSSEDGNSQNDAAEGSQDENEKGSGDEEEEEEGYNDVRVRTLLPSLLEVQCAIEGGEEPTAQQVEASHMEAAQIEYDRLVKLLGLSAVTPLATASTPPPPPTSDQMSSEKESKDDVLIWDNKSLGLQSRRFVLQGNRWKGRAGTQLPIDNNAPASVHAKTLPPFTVPQLVAILEKSVRIAAEVSAKELGKNEDEIKAAGDIALQEVSLDFPTEPTVQLKRERKFLRAWASAALDGDLNLPSDTLLVVPRLFDDVVVDCFDDSGAVAREEDKPTVLIMEDLIAAGFKPNVFINPMHIDDLTALSLALADFHAAAWSIRLRLGHVEEAKTNSGAAADGFPKLDTFRDGLRAAVDSLRGQGESSTAETVMAQLPKIVTSLFEHEPEVTMYCHGDPWADNVMFRRDTETGKVNGVAFVDLAGYRLGSPLCDFYGFVSSSTSAEVRQENEQMLSEVYTKRLGEQLKAEAQTDTDIKEGKGKGGSTKRRCNKAATPPDEEEVISVPKFDSKVCAHAMAMTVNFFLHEEMWLASDELRDRRTAALSQAASFAKVVALDDRAEATATADD